MTRYERLKAEGRCVGCGITLHNTDHVRCDNCREYERAKRKIRYEQDKKKCVYPDCFNCPKDDCTRTDFYTGAEKEAFNIKQRYERK